MFSIDPENPTVILLDGVPVAETGLQAEGDDGGLTANSKLAAWFVKVSNAWDDGILDPSATP
jgi:hypothetical protein